MMFIALNFSQLQSQIHPIENFDTEIIAYQKQDHIP